MILKCECRHDFQDRLYGEGRRVFNMCKPGSPQQYRCTVCNKVITKGVVGKTKKEKK